MSKRKFLKMMVLSIVLPLGACGEKIDSSTIVDVHWKCDLVVNGDRTGSTEDFMFRRSGMVRHIIYPPDGSDPSFWQGDYKVDGVKFEITDRVLGSTMITGINGPSFVGKFTRTEPSHMQFEGDSIGDVPTKIKGDCVPQS
jgi:hypothetical protein